MKLLGIGRHTDALNRQCILNSDQRGSQVGEQGVEKFDNLLFCYTSDESSPCIYPFKGGDIVAANLP